MPVTVAAVFIISITISCLFLDRVIKTHDEETVKMVAADVYEAIHHEISRSVIVSRTMASDSFLKENLKNEVNIPQDEEINLMKNYLDEINTNFKHNITFVISNASKKYYYNKGFNRVIDPEDNPYDFWYREFLNKRFLYALDVDVDEFDKNLWTVFINARIEDENQNLLGVCGTGISMLEFQKIMNEKESEHEVKIDLFDPKENYSIDTNAAKFKDPHLRDIVTSLQQSAGFSTNRFTLAKFDDVFVVVKYIAEINNYLIVRRDITRVRGMFSDLVFQILLSSGISLAILLIFIQIRLRNERKAIEEEATRLGIVSHADKYASMHLIDLKDNSIHELSRNDKINLMAIQEGKDAAQKIKNSLIAATKPESLKDILQFISFDTMLKRIHESHAIQQEFLTNQYGWCKAHFMLVDNTRDQVIFALELIDEEKRKAEHLKYLSETDAMTGLKNRGGGESAISELIAAGEIGMFCLLDADKFKSVNDNYGHDVGDKVIKAIADCLKKSFRKSDILMRLGGDEFAIYALGINDEERGNIVINRLFNEIDRINIPELGDRKITISVGSTFCKADENSSFEESYKQADSGTYQSKKIQGNANTYFKD